MTDPRIVYPSPAHDLAEKMSAALAPLSDEELSNLESRLDRYAYTLTTDDILALRGRTFRSMDAIARRDAAARRRI